VAVTDQIDLRYGSELHTKLKRMVLDRFAASQRKVALRYAKWKEAEELYYAYTKPTDDKLAREAKRKSGEFVFSQISIPYSYAMLLTAHTYWSSVFLSRVPVFQYTGRHGESQQQVQALEALIDYQVMVGNMLPVLYLWLLDAGKYGLGVIGNYWAEEWVQTSRIEKRERSVFGIPIPGTEEKVRVVTTVPGYIGNRLYNIRPYDFFPDPSVSISNFQKGEFCGRLTYEGWNDVYSKAMDGYYIKENVDLLKEKWRTTRFDEREFGSSLVDLPESDDMLVSSEEKRVGTVEEIEMVINLVPSEIGLGEGDRPEKWVFTLANRDIVIGASPLGCNHSQFPYFIQTYEIDGYSHNPRGMLEILQPLNAVLDWLYNSHFFNVAKILNDMLVVDPSGVVMKDLLQQGAGKIIRLSPMAQGRDVRSVISQLPVMDVTQGNFRDVQIIMDLMQRVSGAADNLMGVVNTGGRKTATEVRTSSSFGVNRLRTFSEYNSALGWDPLSQVLVQNSQQFYDVERQYKIAGDLMSTDPKYIVVGPEDIAGFYTFVPVDGTMPIDRMAQANLWKEILLGMNQMPQLAQQYDMAGIFAWMAQIAGLKNISQFKIKVMPDQALMQQAQAGNLIPAKPGGEAMDNGSGAGALGNATPL